MSVLTRASDLGPPQITERGWQLWTRTVIPAFQWEELSGSELMNESHCLLTAVRLTIITSSLSSTISQSCQHASTLGHLCTFHYDHTGNLLVCSLLHQTPSSGRTEPTATADLLLPPTGSET